MGRIAFGRWLARLVDGRAGSSAAELESAPQPYMLEGSVMLGELLRFRAWASALAEPYQPETGAMAAIAAHMAEAELLIFLATWCGDCKREMPRLLQVLAQAGWPEERLHLIGVDWDKRDPDGLVDAWQVERVPTIVATRGGRELGRIVERPQMSLERDLASLLSG